MCLKYSVDVKWQCYDFWNSIQILTRDTHKIGIKCLLIKLSMDWWPDGCLLDMVHISWTCHYANPAKSRNPATFWHEPKSSYILAWAGFVKMAGFRLEPDPKSGTAQTEVSLDTSASVHTLWTQLNGDDSDLNNTRFHRYAHVRSKTLAMNNKC